MKHYSITIQGNCIWLEEGRLLIHYKMRQKTKTKTKTLQIKNRRRPLQKVQWNLTIIWFENEHWENTCFSYHTDTHPSVFSLKQKSKMSIRNYYWCYGVNLDQKAVDISRNIYCHCHLEVKTQSKLFYKQLSRH